MPCNNTPQVHPISVGIDTKHQTHSLSPAQKERASAARRLPAAHGIPPPSGYYKSTFPRDASRPSKEWMAAFCSEPEGDVSTCCLGWWVPCALYGKTHWRLYQLLQKKDPLDSSWKAEKGFNPACCIYTIWMSGGRTCECIPTAFERNRIRATYGIDGSCGGDFCCACWCNQCVLMQNDREVRAREGELKCRTNHRFGADMLRDDGRTIINASPMLVTFEPSQENLMLYPEAESVTSGRSPAIVPSSLGGDSDLHTPPNGGQIYLERKPNVLKKPAQSPNILITKAESTSTTQPDVELVDIRVPSDTAVNNVEEIASSHTNNARCISVQDISQPQLHGYTDLKENGNSSLPTVSGHRRNASAPSLKSCITLVIGCDGEDKPVGRRVNKGQKKQQMSYIHDFTTSDVNRKVLEYYEKEENSYIEPKSTGLTSIEVFYSSPHVDPIDLELTYTKDQSAIVLIEQDAQIRQTDIVETVKISSPAPNVSSFDTSSSSASHSSDPAEQRLENLTDTVPVVVHPIPSAQTNSESSSNNENFTTADIIPKVTLPLSGAVHTHTVGNCPDNATKHHLSNEHHIDDCERASCDDGDSDSASEKSFTTSQEDIIDGISSNAISSGEKGKGIALDEVKTIPNEHVAENASITDHAGRHHAINTHTIEDCETIPTEINPLREHRVDECCSVDGAMEAVNNASRERNSDNLSEVLAKAFQIPNKRDQEENEKARAVIAKTHALREFLARAKAHQISYQEQDEAPATSPPPRTVSPIPRGLDLNAISKARKDSTKEKDGKISEPGYLSTRMQSSRGHRGFEQM